MKMTGTMAKMKSKWGLPLLWINLSIVFVYFVLLVSDQISFGKYLLHMFVFALIYANITGILGMVALNSLARRLSLRDPLAPILVLGVVVCVAAGCLLAQSLLIVIGFVPAQRFWFQYFQTLKLAMPLALVFGLGAMVHGSLRSRVQTMQEKLSEKDAVVAKAQKLAAEARLQSLESRIQPHFLFNTLNSISSLTASNPERAEQIVGRLSLLLRASLDNTNQPLISLRQELDMVENYLDIESVRLGEKLKRSLLAPPELLEAKVPPMSVQSLVENAVKHGITPQSAGGEVTVQASSQNGKLHIEVRDTGPGFDVSTIPAGRGLDQLTQRLDTLFNERAYLRVARRDGHSIVEMILPLS
jgi:two-component system, LytTR family, sensor histidine kinase AlgZ